MSGPQSGKIGNPPPGFRAWIDPVANEDGSHDWIGGAGDRYRAGGTRTYEFPNIDEDALPDGWPTGYTVRHNAGEWAQLLDPDGAVIDTEVLY